jgi:hypothetical protein
MSRIPHFEISTNDPDKMIAFYETVFGWKVTKWEGPVDYWLINTGDPVSPGIDGAFFRPNELLNGTVNTVEVDDLDAAIDKVVQNGGQVLVEKNTIPGVGYQAYCKDVEGTIFGVHQSDPTAS